MKMSKAKWYATKKKAPKVPDLTCPIIDDIIDRLEKNVTLKGELTMSKYKVMVNRLEQLRKANDKLRDSSHYWYTVAKRLADQD